MVNQTLLRWQFLLFCLVGLGAVNVHAQSSVQKATDRLLNNKAMRTASMTCTVKEVKTGKVVAIHQSNTSLSPASSLKVVTTATALALLGKDYRFKTELQYDGIISEGILDGNIFIKGYGDPTLGSERLDGNLGYEALMNVFATVIRKAGIKEIKGKIVADATFFESASTPPSWQWDDLGNYYGAGVYGLNISENMYHLILQQTSKLGGRPSVVKTIPKLYNTWLINELSSDKKGTGDNCYIYAAPRQHTRILRGTIPVGKGTFKMKGSLPDPPFTAASMLLNALERKGTTTNKEATTIFLSKNQGITFDSPRTILYTHKSPSLYDIAKITNEKSINLYAEALLKLIGKKTSGIASSEKGIEGIQAFWEERGVKMDGFFMMDGSGLSARNGITSHQITSMLRKIKVAPALDFDFQKTLPIAGQTGTMRWMFKKTAAEGKIFAKTGSMDRIRSYSGYAQSRSGKLLAFSIIVNNYSCSNKEARQLLKTWMMSLVQY